MPRDSAVSGGDRRRNGMRCGPPPSRSRRCCPCSRGCCRHGSPRGRSAPRRPGPQRSRPDRQSQRRRHRRSRDGYRIGRSGRSLSHRCRWLWGSRQPRPAVRHARGAGDAARAAGRRPESPHDPRHAAIADASPNRLGCATPRLTTQRARQHPARLGPRRAHVLLPRASHDWPDERVWAVCAHEMAHISRGDWIAHLLAEIVCRIYWFNPLFWTARNRIEPRKRAGRRRHRHRPRRQRHRLRVASDRDRPRGTRRIRGLSPTVAMARGSGLERRIAALLSGLVQSRAAVARRGRSPFSPAPASLPVPLAALGARTPLDHRDPAPRIFRRSTTSAVRELAGDDSEPVREIRVLEPARRQTWLRRSPSTRRRRSIQMRHAARGVEGVVLVQARIDRGRPRGARRE